MTVSKSRLNYSFYEGKKAENKFQQLMIERNNTCFKSNSHDDINKHIDFYVNDFTVDVKGNRHLNTIWLELKNVRGLKGWLECCADYIVFDIIELKGFCVFLRKKLFNYCLQFKDVAKDKTEYKKLYTRKDRKDLLIKVKYEHIKHLQTQIINY
tara:strand:+ start:239 stop:700 length:462 start_codon:yes stop_codon:yes gene_type:complete